MDLTSFLLKGGWVGTFFGVNIYLRRLVAASPFMYSLAMKDSQVVPQKTDLPTIPSPPPPGSSPLTRVRKLSAIVRLDTQGLQKYVAEKEILQKAELYGTALVSMTYAV